MDTLTATHTAARPQPPLPEELTRLLTAAHAALEVQGEGQEGWWGTVTLPGHTHDVQARVTPDGLDLFLGNQLLFVRSEHARYVNHAALGLDPWDALRCLIDLENSALVLHGSDARWLLPVQDDFSVRGVGAPFMPHTAAGHLSLLGVYPGGQQPGVLLFPDTLLEIAWRSGVSEPYPAPERRWLPGPPQRPGTYWLALPGETRPQLTTLTPHGPRHLHMTHPRTFEAEHHFFVPEPALP